MLSLACDRGTAAVLRSEGLEKVRSHTAGLSSCLEQAVCIQVPMSSSPGLHALG